MDVAIEDVPAQARWQALLGDTVIGYVAYELGEGEVTFTHTVVDPAYEGHGLAGAMVRAALDDARERGLAVLPRCPYVRAWLGRHPDELDLVPADRRAAYGL